MSMARCDCCGEVFDSDDDLEGFYYRVPGKKIVSGFTCEDCRNEHDEDLEEVG